MTDHRDFQAELAAYTASRLEGEPARRLEAHLRECGECREMASSLKEFGRTLRQGGETFFDGHPTPAELADFARGAASEGREAIARHLESCASCGLEVDAWKRVRVRTGPSPGRMAWPLAAGVLVGIGLAAFAKMTLFPQRQASQGFSGPEATAGPMLVLPPLVRSSGETVTAPLHRDSGFVVVACPARIPEDASPEQSFVYVLHAADGDDKAIWSQVMSARSIREHLGSPAASVILLVPAASLRPGRYEFALGREGSGEEPVYRVDVELTGAR